MSNLSARIQEKRERERLTLREAGKASGVAFATLGRIQNGAEPSHNIAKKIEAWLDGHEPLLPPPPMTLRDWFAGQAVAGLLANTSIERGAALEVADWAYAVADAMLAVRKGPPDIVEKPDAD